MNNNKINSFDWLFWFKWLMSTTLGWVLGSLIQFNLAFVTIGIAIGIFQWLVLRDIIPNAWRWIIATTVGWLAGSTLLRFFIPQSPGFLAGIILGVGVGIAQYLVLRREIYLAGWWIVINIIAWTTGMAYLSGILTTGVVVGVITGFALELLLRNTKQGPSPDREFTS